MRMGFGIRVILSVAIVAAVVSYAYGTLTPRDFPVSAQPLDANIVVLHPLAGLPLPPGIEDGDRVDIRKLDFITRATAQSPKKPLGYEIQVPIERGGKTLIVPAKVVDLSDVQAPGQPNPAWFRWTGIAVNLLLGAIAMLLLWRGRDRAAFGMGLWAITFLFSVGLGAMPQAGWVAIGALALSIGCFLVARVGFYIMIDARLGSGLNTRQRGGFRTAFYILLAFGALQQFIAQYVRTTTGSLEYTAPQYGLILTASYLVPIVMLFVGYRSATAAERLPLRWMLLSGGAWAANILVGNSPVLGGTVSGLLSTALQAIALLGFLYAVLRLRVVDISVVIDRALVYGLVVALVVGVLAAVNSLVLRETLTPGAGLALQVLVPLALGIVLNKVRSYADKAVEQLFFRNRYLAEKALKTFARHAGHIASTEKLLDTAADEIHRQMGAPAVALYSIEEGSCTRIAQAGNVVFPASVDQDDPVMVALKAGEAAADLDDYRSGLGEDGCAFPMTVLGKLRGAIVCANRPGAHYAPYEKQLLADVARDVGAAWRILRARDNEALVQALAQGALPVEALREKARALAAAGG